MKIWKVSIVGRTAENRPVENWGDYDVEAESLDKACELAVNLVKQDKILKDIQVTKVELILETDTSQMELEKENP